MRRRGIQHHLDGLLALLLFGVFAVCVLSVLLTGARAYRGLTRRDQAAFDRRSCVQYIATRVRQADIEGGVAVEPFGEITALALTSEGFTTRVYCYDGWLMELYTAQDAELEPEAGERVMELDSLELSLEDGLLTARIGRGGGGTDTLQLSLRSGEEGAE